MMNGPLNFRMAGGTLGESTIQFRVWTLKAWVYHNEVNDVIMCIRFAMTLFGGPLGKKLIGLARKAKGFSSGGL